MKILTIYTDGSHLDKQNNGRLGCGGIAVDFSKPYNKQEVGRFSQELIPEFLRLNYGTDKCSNPSAELLGVYCALVHFKSLIKNYDKIIFKADYNGVQMWMTKRWRIKEPYIQKMKDDIDQEIKDQELQGKVEFDWVKGHQTKVNRELNPDGYWNNYVDLVAKGQDDGN